MRFILLAQKRTGTTVFRSLANQHDSLHLYNEAFFPDKFPWGWYAHLGARLANDPDLILPGNMGREIMPYFDQLAAAKEKRGKLAVGVDVKLSQAQQIRDFHHHLKSSDYGILHMRRRNTLAAIISRLTMEAREKRGIRAHGSAPAVNEPLYLDPEYLALQIENHELQDRIVNWTYREKKYLQVCYEDFTTSSGWKTACGQLSDFFGFPFQVDFVTHLTKQNSSNLAELLKNADEVQNAYPQFFDPD
jgi:hypothetical protein